METFEKKIQRIEERNKKVEIDKAWETSWTRRLLLSLFTYLAIGAYLWSIRVPRPWLNAIVPAVGFMISTLTMPFFKQRWLKSRAGKTDRMLEKVKKLNLPSGQYALFGSSPMAVRGLRESWDIDIIVTPEVFESCRKEAKWQLARLADGNEYLIDDDIEIFKNWAPGEWVVKELIDSAEIIGGLPFVSLENVIKWKKIYGRKKDLKDLDAIEKFLQANEK